MILLVFAVRDKAVNAFMPPFYARTKGEAIRSFMSAVSENDAFKRSPGDYDLYYLAAYDDSAGTFEGVSPERLLGGLEVGSKQ